VRRAKELAKAAAASILATWWKENSARLTASQAPPVPALDLVKEIHRYLREELLHVGKEHKDQVETILLDMSALLPGFTVPQVTRKVYREILKPAMMAGVATKTWANKRSYLKAFFEWEMNQEDDNEVPHLARSPLQGDKAPDPRQFGTHEEIWEFEDDTFPEVLALVRKDPRLKAEDRARFAEALEDLWFTGIDVKDLWNLEPHAHIIETKVTTADGKLRKAWKLYKIRGKEWEIIDQPIDAPIRDRWAAAKATALPGEKLHAWARRYANNKSWARQMLNAVMRARTALGLPHRDLKCIRHTFETRWARVYTESRGQRGPSPEEMRKWMGRAPGSTVGQKIYDKNKAWMDPAMV
jgi:hypothetical protein